MPHYRHVWNSGKDISLPVGKVVCVGQNYAAHLDEMKAKKTADPVLFLKPDTALVSLEDGFAIPPGYEVHHEIELVLLIGETMKRESVDHVMKKIAGYGVGLDLTLRDLQSRLKQAGLPWEKSKAFDGSAPVSTFIPAKDFPDPQNVELMLRVNDAVRQNGSTSTMLWRLPELLAHASQFFTLQPGDLFFTGTPAGVGPLQQGDVLSLSLADQFHFQTRVI